MITASMLCCFILFKFRNFGHIIDNPIDTDTNMAILLNLFQSASYVALFLTNYRSPKSADAGALANSKSCRQSALQVDLISMPIDTIGCSYTSIEETQIIVDSRRCPNVERGFY